MKVSNVSEEKEPQTSNDNSKREEPSSDKVNSIHKKIIKNLLDSLGTPPHLRRVEVRKVGLNVYRVNVVCPNYKKGSYIVSSQRPHSYYVTVEKNDEVIDIKFNPPVKQTYF